MKTLIKNGTLVDPYNHIMGKLNLLLDEGRVLEVTRSPEGNRLRIRL